MSEKTKTNTKLEGKVTTLSVPKMENPPPPPPKQEVQNSK